MAQSLYDPFTGVVLDNATQSMLDSQGGVGLSTDTPPTTSVNIVGMASPAVVGNSLAPITLDEDDVFQCGKCKKQFTSLPLFMDHKREQCGLPGSSEVHPSVPANHPGDVNPFDAVTTGLSGSLNSPAITGTAPVAFVNQIPLSQPIILNDSDILSFSIDHNALGIARTSSQALAESSFLSSSAEENAAQGEEDSAFLTSSVEEEREEEDEEEIEGKVQVLALDTVTAMATGGGGQPSTKGKKFKCAYCEKTFSKNFDLQQHVRRHTGEKPFQCVVCGRAFSQKSNVKKHMQTHKVWPNGLSQTLPKEPIQTVVTTEESAETVLPDQIVSPLKAEGVEEEEEEEAEEEEGRVQVIVDNSYVCQYCGQSFRAYFGLKTHMKTHLGEKVYRCVQRSCSLTFADLDPFLEHVRSHEADGQYRCHVCNRFFPSLYDMGVHQYTHTLSSKSPSGARTGTRQFRCSKCMNKYATPEALEHHQSTSTHNYPCPHCNHVFTCERYLRRHLPTHSTVGLFPCQLCSKTFKTEHYLKVHQLIHSGEKPFQCALCQASFNRKDKLKRHLLIHEPSKKFKCPFRSYLGCTREFNRPDKLKLHLLTHSAVKPFQCKTCGKTFLRNPRLREHEKAHHCEANHTCSACGLGFKKKQQLAAHQCSGSSQERQGKKSRGRRKVSRAGKVARTRTARGELGPSSASTQSGCASTPTPALASAPSSSADPASDPMSTIEIIFVPIGVSGAEHPLPQTQLPNSQPWEAGRREVDPALGGLGDGEEGEEGVGGGDGGGMVGSATPPSEYSQLPDSLLKKDARGDAFAFKSPASLE